MRGIKFKPIFTFYIHFISYLFFYNAKKSLSTVVEIIFKAHTFHDYT